MVGLPRFQFPLSLALWPLGLMTLSTTASAFAEDPPAASKASQDSAKDKLTPAKAKDDADKSKDEAKTAEPKLSPADFGLPGENPPATFVPKTPRTVEERKEIETIRLFATARSLEERKQFREAIKTLEQALASDPDSLAILRRLSRLCGALGQLDKSVEYGRKILAADPGDTETLVRLVEYYRGRRRDPAKAEALLKEALANPKLDKAGAGHILIEFELGQLYAATQRFNQAADAFAKVVDALDAKSALKLSLGDQRRILGQDEAAAYQDFGLIFLAAKRKDLALRAFQRGLVYSPDSPQLAVLLAQMHLESGEPDKALKFVESLMKLKPAGREIYDLFAQVLISLKREKEIIPRFESFAKADPKNVGLQYSLADRYRAVGKTKEADDLLTKLIDIQPDLQGFAGLFSNLLKQKKSEELLKLLEKVSGRLKREDAVRPQIEVIAADPEYAVKLIDTGLVMLSEKPPKLERAGWAVLMRLAVALHRVDKTIELLRWSIKENPDPLLYRELAIRLSDSGKNDDAEKTVAEMFAKFPNERNTQSLLLLGQIRLRSNKQAQAVEALQEARKLEPADPIVNRVLAFALSQAGKVDDAIALLRESLKNEPTNPDLNGSLGSILTTAGRNDEAIAFWKALLDKFPNNEDVNRVARSSLSIIYTNLGDFAKGEAELELLFAKNPDDVGVNNDLGYLYADQGKNLEKAEEMIRKAVSGDDENTAYLDSLGWVLFKRGKFKEAAIHLEKAVKLLTTEDATMHDHLGDVYFELKEREKAKIAWQKAEKIAAAAKPPDKRLGDIRKKLESLRTLKTGSAGGPGTNP